MKYRSDNLRRLLAAEYALGTLPRLARRRFERLLAGDRRLRRELAVWEQRLHLLQVPTPEAPRDVVWSGIERHLQAQQRLSLPPPLPISADPRPLRRWRALAMAASLAAIGLGAGLWQQWLEGPHIIERVRTVQVAVPVAQPLYVALLQPTPTEPAQWLVTLQPGEKRLKIMASGHYPMDRAQQDLQLWLLDDSGTPRALAMLPESGVMEMPLPMPLPTQPVLAVSLEPRGGSPSGQPSGPMLSQVPMLKL